MTKPLPPSSPHPAQPSSEPVSVHLKPGENLRISIDVHAAVRSGESGELDHPKPSLSQKISQIKLPAWTQKIHPTIAWVFWLAIAVFLLTRLIGLVQFPIFFYSDEAVPGVRISDLLDNDLRDQDNRLLPTFFLNDRKYNLGLSVYLLAIPHLLFGNHIWVSRGLTVLICLAGFIWVYKLIQQFYKLKYGWLGGLLLLAVPAWFLFSRFAIETPIMTTFYAGFLYYYMRYRQENPKYIYHALLLGAAAFYSYFPGQVIVVATALVLLILDFRYHWQNIKKTWPVILVLILLIIPLIRFMITQPDQYANRLTQYGSYMSTADPLMDKVFTYLSTYLYGLSPLFWFNPNAPEPVWWVMKGYSQLPLIFLPFLIWGMVQAVRKWRQPEMRLALVAWLVGPSAAALMDIEITRVLCMVIPGVVLTAIGFDHALNWLETRWKPSRWLAVLAAVGCLAASPLMLVDSLVNAPTWSTDYGRSGLQWGSRQLFAAAWRYHTTEPDTPIYISGAWSWQADVEMRFFVPDDSNIYMRNADEFIRAYDPNVNNIRFILLQSDYDNAVDSGRFCDTQIEGIISYPDGTPGFYVVRLPYCSGIEQVFEAEYEARLVLTTDSVMIDGMDVQIEHSTFANGTPDRLFDGNLDTFVTTDRLNPLVLVLHFPNAQTVSGYSLNLGSESMTITTTLTDQNGEQTVITTQVPASGNRQDDRVTFPTAEQVVDMRIEVLQDGLPDDSSIPCWEMILYH